MLTLFVIKSANLKKHQIYSYSSSARAKYWSLNESYFVGSYARANNLALQRVVKYMKHWLFFK